MVCGKLSKANNCVKGKFLPEKLTALFVDSYLNLSTARQFVAHLGLM
ncbi:MAG: hypothetical protein ACLR5N_03580 [Haemophilus parainfluenzae]